MNKSLYLSLSPSSCPDLSSVVRRLLNVVAALILCAVLASFVRADMNASAQTVVVVGDSLSAAYGIDQSDGWVALINERLESEGIKATLVNASISGATTTDGLDKLPGILSRHHPDVVVIELGGNDGLRGQPVPGIKRNLEAMMKLASEASRVVLIGIRLPPNYGPRYVGSFEQTYRDLAAQYDAPLVPFLLEGVAGEEGMMQADGIHPTASGQPRIVENVWPILIKVLTNKTKNAEK